MKAVVKIITYPLHLEEPPKFIMCLVLRTHLLIQTQSHHAVQVQENHTTDQFSDVDLQLL